MEPRSAADRTVPVLVLATTTLLVVAAGTVSALLVRDELPDPVAVHWGTGGADGFMSLGSALLAAGALIAVLGGMFTAMAWAMHPSSAPMLVGVGSGTVAGIAGLVYGSTVAQAGLADAADADLPVALLVLAPAAAIVVGVVTARVVRRPPPPLPTERVTVRAPHVRWNGRLRMRRGAAVVMALLAAASLIAAIASGSWLALVPVAAVIVIHGTCTGRVTIDPSGLTLRSPLGPRTLHVPLGRVTSARTTHVAPLRQYGGWGIRIRADGTRGHISRAGMALLVSRHLEPDVVLTLDDPGSAAEAVRELLGSADGSSDRP